MATYVIGDYIREIRLRKGYTQEDVSFGICTSATLSRIENGAQTPGRYILDKLMERLGMENSVFNIFVSKEEMELYECVQEMVRNIADGNFEELEKADSESRRSDKENITPGKTIFILCKGRIIEKEKRRIR